MELGRRFFLLLAPVVLLWSSVPSAEPAVVRHVKGLVHGFLSLRSPEGAVIANGDLIQDTRGGRVTSRLVYDVKDGSLQDETAVFSQRAHFEMMSDHLVQKGPTLNARWMIDWPTGHVVVRYKNEHGEERVEDEHMDLPPDLADGVIITLLKGVRREALPPSVSLVAAMPKPRLVEVTMAIGGTEPFSVAGSAPKATHYFLKIEIGGIAALVAPLVGKQPPDSHVWILDGEASAFVRSQAATFNGRSSVADGPRESHLAQLTTSLVAVTSAGAAIDDARS